MTVYLIMHKGEHSEYPNDSLQDMKDQLMEERKLAFQKQLGVNYWQF